MKENIKIEGMKFLDTDIPKEYLMLIDIKYKKPDKKSGDSNDYLSIVYKDIRDKKVHLQIITNPEIPVYFTKPEYRNYTFIKSFIEIDKTYMKMIPYKNLVFDIAAELGPNTQSYVRSCMQSGNYSAIKNVFKNPYVFGCDLPIEAIYRAHWNLSYHDDTHPKELHKMYFDIETDIIDIVGFPDGGNCPVFMITAIDERSMTSYSFFLRNPDNPLIVEFEERIHEFVNKLHENFDESYGRLDYQIRMYDNELDLLKDFSNLINMIKPDILAAWNGGSFDYPFLFDRLVNEFGANPVLFFTHPDFKNARQCYYIRDFINYKAEAKKDRFITSSYTLFLDQMQIYARNRKAQSALRSTALTTVAQEIIEDSKLDYSNESNLKRLPYTGTTGTPGMRGNGYATYCMYNIKDVLLQMGIEKKANDFNALYNRCIANCIDYANAYSQTRFLDSRGYLEYFLQGLIIGNNRNSNYGERKEEIKMTRGKDVKFSGAIVADPTLNSRNGMEILGRRSNRIFTNIVDFDYSALYPSIIISHNIAPNTIVGKLLINETVDDLMNTINKETERILTQANEMSDEDDDIIDDEGFTTEGVDPEDNGRKFTEDYLTGNTAIIGSKWFGLPTIEELVSEFNEYVKEER